MRELELCDRSHELHLVCDRRKVYRLRADADAPASVIQVWFDQLVVRIDELRARGEHDRPQARRPPAASPPWFALPLMAGGPVGAGGGGP